ncbi:Chloramphenicol acetyltransferase-like domain-containing protein [Artemisia annua]|uniref:Chloramphenicol acetyltransferase-like domain-containing protein n=1 Tax=Artemisia annua TaxID=35608 RepID=A0A2U1Q866_ARTAN|nr:Chloramphenicol acetyltransferase-like domain-containing protein [Artemisia annua]
MHTLWRKGENQVVLTPYVPLTLYYPSLDGDDVHKALERSTALKTSLSKTLTQFYPLAGTLKDDVTVDCNDIGANYVVAMVNRRLYDYLSHLNLQWVNKFLPCEPNSNGSSLTNVQVNIFECGGMAIGMCISHKILDGASLAIFLKAWTDMACGSTQVVHPNLSAPSLFPVQTSPPTDILMKLYKPLLKQGKCVTKRFVFDTDAITKLKAQATSVGVQRPSRLEVVIALIWKCAISASKDISGYQKPSGFTQIVNLRPKLGTPLSKDMIGNLVWMVIATCGANYETTLHGLMEKVRQSSLKVDSEFVEKAQGDEGYVAMHKSLEEMVETVSKESINFYGFTSLCKVGFYDFDFGWAKPIWMTGIVAQGSPMFMNMINLFDMKSGDGVEAWVHLDEQEMEILESNQELLAFASLDPSPLE